MRYAKSPDEPEQKLLFDAEVGAWWLTQLSPEAHRQLSVGMEGVIRRSILKLLPAEKLGEHFHDWMGRPSKELYAMCGLLLLAEFRDWTIDQAASAWGLDAGVQYALNLPRDRQYLCAHSGTKEKSPKEGAKAPATWAEKRRAEQESKEWKKLYALRSGVEGVNEALDRTTGMKALRVRGRHAVHMAIYLKVTGWNIKSAAAILKKRVRHLSTAAAHENAGQKDGKSARTNSFFARRRSHRRSRRHQRLSHRPPSPRYGRLPCCPAPVAYLAASITVVAEIDFAPASEEESAALGRNSASSNKPPSSDRHNPNRPEKGQRRGRGRRRPEGQKGHPGSTVERVADPDHVVGHPLPGRCDGCAASLRGVVAGGHEARQVFDLPEKITLEPPPSPALARP